MTRGDAVSSIGCNEGAPSAKLENKLETKLETKTIDGQVIFMILKVNHRNFTSKRWNLEPS